MITIPTIETPRLRLTALNERHFDDYAAMLADPDSTRWIGDGLPLDRTNAWRSLAMLIGHWQLRGYGMWALELKATGEKIVGLPWYESLMTTTRALAHVLDSASLND